MSISLVLYAHPPFKPDHVAEVSKIRNVLVFPLCFGSPSEDHSRYERWRLNSSHGGKIGMSQGFHWDFMGFYWDFMGFKISKWITI